MTHRPFLFLLSAVLFFATSGLLNGQTPCGEQYARILAEGDALFKNGQYKKPSLAQPFR